MATPVFNLIYPLPTVVRRNVPPAEIADALKVNSGSREFSDHIMALNGLSVREGQWVTRNSSGLIVLATSTNAIAWPVWQDPGAGRTDGREGGMTIIQGTFSARTNVINTTAIAVNDELCVGTLPGGHAVLPSAGGGLVRRATLAGGTQHMVVAHVEKVYADGTVQITNQNTGYFKAGG